MDTLPPSSHFTKVYPAGWQRMRRLVRLKGGPTVTALWMLLAEHCDRQNAIVVSQETLAEELGVHRISVWRAIEFLKNTGVIAVLKMGSANVYVLDPDLVWKDAEQHKRFCAFGAKVLAGFTENDGLKAKLDEATGQQTLEV